jgi:hydrogenase maturation protease
MMPQRILVAGIGNVFLGDDGFGVEVAQRLAACSLPDDVRVVDFGIRGFDLAYALMEGYDTSILVDAMQRGQEPGTLCVIEPDLNNLDSQGEQLVDTHAMHPLRVLQLVKALGGSPGRVLVVGCEPMWLTPEEDGNWQMGLSAPVEAAVDEAAKLVESLVTQCREGSLT